MNDTTITLIEHTSTLIERTLTDVPFVYGLLYYACALSPLYRIISYGQNRTLISNERTEESVD